MAYSTGPESEAVYPAIEAWVDRCLRHDDSLFTPGRPVWTLTNLEENYRIFVERVDESSSTYVEKLIRQLAGASDEAIQCAAECEWVLLVMAQSSTDLKTGTKQKAVGDILAQLRVPFELPEVIRTSFEGGLCNTGLATRTLRWMGRLFLIEFGVSWKRLTPEQQNQYLEDPWAFKTWLFSLPTHSGFAEREALLHFVHPRTFEIIINRDHKRAIATTFADRSSGSTDVDRAISDIRTSFEAETDGPFGFYEPGVVEQWLEKKQPKHTPPSPPSPEASHAESGSDLPSRVILSPVTQELADTLLLPRDWLQEEIVDLLTDKRQIVLYGPPGTGKTYLAMTFAKHLTVAGGEARLIQFHPSYAYEDFFEGYRPVGTGATGSVTFALVPGPLKQMADAARADPHHPYVLVVDELNRANLAKVFGELYFLLEYRDRAIGLQYRPGEEYRLPENLYVIGTMNTADRSIALVDAAMRRRFYFVGLFPTRTPIDALLAAWLDRYDLPLEPADLLMLLNTRLGDEDISIGPSYLMTARVAEEGGLERIWKRAILPLLEEHFYGSQRDVETEFGLAGLRSALTSSGDGAAAIS